MSFQPIITAILNDPGAVVVEMTYTDGQSKIQKEYRLTFFDLDNFKRTVQDQLNELNSTDKTVVQSSLALGPFDPTITPPDPPSLTPIQKFAKDVQLLRNYQNAVNLRILASDDSRYTAQLQKVTAAFDESFIGVI